MRDAVAQSVHALDSMLQLMHRSLQIRKGRTQSLLPQQLLPGIFAAWQHEPPGAKRHGRKKVLVQRLPPVLGSHTG